MLVSQTVKFIRKAGARIWDGQKIADTTVVIRMGLVPLRLDLPKALGKQIENHGGIGMGVNTEGLFSHGCVLKYVGDDHECSLKTVHEEKKPCQ